MIQLLGFDIGSSVSEIVQGASEFVLAVCAVSGGVFALKKWSREKLLERSKTLDSLLEKFNNNQLRKFVCSIDSSGGASELIATAMSEKGEDAKIKVEDALTFVAQLCQLKTTKVISENEFRLFKDSILKIIDDDDVKRYICQTIADSGMEPKDTHYALLLEFAKENGISIDIKTAVSDTRDDSPITQDVVKTEVTDLSHPIQKVEFGDVPTAIIKINRLYRDGMDDTEVYNKVRGWWRLRMCMAKQVKIVLAVANGSVKGVYRANKWIESPYPDLQGRVGFDGVRAEESIRQKFIHRSTKALFSKGAANPVRYFNVKQVIEEQVLEGGSL